MALSNEHDPEKAGLISGPRGGGGGAPLRRTSLDRAGPAARFGVLIGAVVSAGALWTCFTASQRAHPGAVGGGPLCEQFSSVLPPAHAADANKEIIFSSAYQTKSAGILSGLVQIPHQHLNRTLINTYGLLYEWKGSDPSLKPTMFMAHVDVVPVNPATVDDWTHPPYSGFFDGRHLWGRGSVDCKDTVSALLEALELLLEKDFVPRRSVILSFGFDEESAGTQGAGRLGAYLESYLGKDSVAFIVDEGGGGVGEMWGTAMALPGTGEKGYIDVTVSLTGPGGHSSVPPDHTSIGIISSIVTALEDAPFSPSLPANSPILSLLQCAATHGELSKSLKTSVLAASQPGKKGEKGRQKLAEQYAALGGEERYLVQTSQAVDVISGGVKVNALPETANFTANYRINIDSSPKDVKDKITKQLFATAKKYKLDVDAFGTTYSFRPSPQSPSRGVLKAIGIGELEAAPVSLTSARPWEVLSSTIQHAFSNRFPDGLVVSPGMDTGNTDTHSYWSLTKNIYRFTPSDPSSNEFIHTVDEHLLFSEHTQSIWFFHELLRNADAADL
ncbi:peptidase family M20/M25/M40 [Pseudohyphozyma bogoriensis]|nr:peptidase family M20/M25/M40 [Pseudohyphozyma bogoriensis]